MIVASSFLQSEKARKAEFTTAPGDSPLIAQFAANNAVDFANVAEMVAQWAMSEGLGSHLISKPELLSDMVKQARNRIPNQNFSVSVKIRILDDKKSTITLCQNAEAAGMTMLTVHARTPAERHQPIHKEMFGLIKSAVTVPVLANGDVTLLSEAKQLVADTGVDGVMTARGILRNPGLFAGHEATPLACIRQWISLSIGYGLCFTQFHHHLMFMLDRHLTRAEKQTFNRLQSTPAVIDYLRQWLGDEAIYDTSDTCHARTAVNTCE